MVLKTVGSGSSGNCYILEAENESLILDCGCRHRDILKSLDFNIKKIKGCLVTHEHGDHAKLVPDLIRFGIPIYGCPELANAFEETDKIHSLREKARFSIGRFSIIPFYVPHTTKDKDSGDLIACPNYGYLIEHPKMGKLLYVTDFEYLPYRFTSQKIQHFLIECNHMDDLIEKDSENFNHVIKGHSSLSVVKDVIRVNRTSYMQNIVLCHLSADNADAARMIEEIQEVAGSRVSVGLAYPDSQIDFDLYPF